MSISQNDVTRPENVSDRVWEDFVRVFINGERPTDVAEGRAPATVSANVKRIREKLGLTEDQQAERQNGGNGETTPSDEANLVSMDEVINLAREMASTPLYGAMFVHERERLLATKPSDSEVTKAQEALRKAQDNLADAEARHNARIERWQAEYDSTMSAIEEEQGFSFEALDERVAALNEEKRTALEAARQTAAAKA